MKGWDGDVLEALLALVDMSLGTVGPLLRYLTFGSRDAISIYDAYPWKWVSSPSLSLVHGKTT